MIVALMYYEAEIGRVTALARLLADIEPSPRDDVHLVLVRQPDTPVDSLTLLTATHCSRKFETSLVESPIGAVGHPQGCTALWTGTVKHFHDLWKNGDTRHATIATFDGGDGVPLHPQWASRLMLEHAATQSREKKITGSPYWVGTCPLHVNPNAVYDLSLFDDVPELITDIPQHDGTLSTNFDIYHRHRMLAHVAPSSVVRTDWRGGGRRADLELMREASTRSLWLHGYKDEDLYWTAREHLSRNPPRPDIIHYTMETLETHEKIRRHLEECSR